MARKAQNSSISIPNGRKRTLAPGFFTDSALLSLSPLHRLFFEGLWCYADRSGRLLDRPIDLKIRILPMDAFDPNGGLADLERVGLLARYRANGLAVIAMKPRAWKEVQRVHPDEPDSALPAPPPGVFVIGNDAAVPIQAIPVHGNVADAPQKVDSRLGIFVPAGSTGSSGSSDRPAVHVKAHQPALLPELEPPPPLPRAASWQEALWGEMRIMRVKAAEENGGAIAEEADLTPAYINTALSRCAAKRGWDHPDKRDLLTLVWAEFLLMPNAAAKGWPLRYFLHEGVFQECINAENKRTDEQPHPDPEITH